MKHESPSSADSVGVPEHAKKERAVDSVRAYVVSAITIIVLAGQQLYSDRANYNDRLRRFGEPARQAWETARETPSIAADYIYEMDKELQNGYLERSAIGVTDEDVKKIMRQYYLYQAKGYWHAAIGVSDEPQPDYSEPKADLMQDTNLHPTQRFAMGQAMMLQCLGKIGGRIENLSITQEEVKAAEMEAMWKDAEYDKKFEADGMVEW